MEFESCRRALSRDELKSVIDGKSIAPRIPMMIHFWTDANAFGERAEMYRKLLNAYPSDVQDISFRIPDVYNAPEDDPEFRWVNFSKPEKISNTALDAQTPIADWEQLDDILKVFPDPNYHGLIPKGFEPDGRYRVGRWWYLLFERLWSLRGMENALTDFYLEPDSVHRLFRALTDFYKVMLERGRKELNLDGIFTSDDIGTQSGPFFSLDIFREFFKPYYKEIIEKAHSLGMHFWLHTCGNVEMFLPDLIEIGLDVIHPIQKHTMDERRIAGLYGNDICIWAGFDVQQTIPYGTADDVRKEVRFLIDTYYKKQGRLMITAGNGITPDCPYESLEALLDETYNYGMNKVKLG